MARGGGGGFCRPVRSALTSIGCPGRDGQGGRSHATTRVAGREPCAPRWPLGATRRPLRPALSPAAEVAASAAPSGPLPAIHAFIADPGGSSWKQPHAQAGARHDTQAALARELVPGCFCMNHRARPCATSQLADWGRPCWAGRRMRDDAQECRGERRGNGWTKGDESCRRKPSSCFVRTEGWVELGWGRPPWFRDGGGCLLREGDRWYVMNR